MDVFAIGKTATFAANKFLSSKQVAKFTNSTEGEVASSPTTCNSFMMLDFMMFIIGVIIGLYAAYLSWMCNSKVGYHMVFKVIFAVFAYLFGLVYLILYLVMKWDVCYVLKAPVKRMK
jgi:hypothetical protein